jgi:glutathione S-transferase
MKLYWFWSTNPQKVRLALEELGLDYELEKIDLYQGDHKKPAYLAVSPRGKVPALEIDGGTLWDSGAIIAYLAEREGRLWPSEGPGKAEALNLLFLEASTFQDLAGVFYWNRVIMPLIGKPSDEARMAKAQTKLLPLFQLLQSQLAAGDYLLGDFSLVDCVYAPWLPVLDLDGFPGLQAWRDRLMARPSWSACEFQ